MRVCDGMMISSLCFTHTICFFRRFVEFYAPYVCVVVGVLKQFPPAVEFLLLVSPLNVSADGVGTART